MDPKHIIHMLALAYLAERNGRVQVTLPTLTELSGGPHKEIKIIQMVDGRLFIGVVHE